MFFKIVILKNFYNIFTKTHVLEDLFNKVAGLKPSNFTKTRLQHRCFPVNIAKFLRIKAADVLKSFAISRRKQMCWNIFLVKLLA